MKTLPDAVAIVLVTQQDIDLQAVLEQALDQAGLKAFPASWLAKGPNRFAIEAIVAGAQGAAGAIAARIKALIEIADTSIDWAVLPAQNRKKRLLICDMDSTIIAEECLDELADFAGLKAEISAITARAMAGELNFEEALTTRVGMLEGLDLARVAQCYNERIHLNAGAKTLVATMKANGAHCLLVSGGFTAFTARVAAAAGFNGHYANTLLDDGKALTGKVGLPILGREAKQERLETAARDLGLTAADALALGDGANDLAMIKVAGLGLAYRAKPIVAAEADAAINATDLTTALFFQGYRADECLTG